MRRTLLKTISLSVMLASIGTVVPAWADDGGDNGHTPAVTPPPAASTLDAAGNINFTVKGDTSIKLAGQTTVCNAASRGAFRFNQASNVFEGCDGAGWKPSLSGNITHYSQTCLDWSSKGWASPEDCIMDGRVHLVYDPINNIGSQSDLYNYYEAGASLSIKQARPPTSSGSAPTSVDCSRIYEYPSKIVACIGYTWMGGTQQNWDAVSSDNKSAWYVRF